MSTSYQARSRAPRIAEAAVDRARLTVVPRAVPHPPRVPFLMLVSLLLVAGVAGLLTFNTSMQQASFAATALEGQADVLAAREQSLKMDLERLRDPQRLGEEARAMGMVPPAGPAFLRLSDGKVLGALEPASPDEGLRVVPPPTLKPRRLDPVPIRAAPRAADRAAIGAAGGREVAGTDTKRQRGNTAPERDTEQGSER